MPAGTHLGQTNSAGLYQTDQGNSTACRFSPVAKTTNAENADHHACWITNFLQGQLLQWRQSQALVTSST